MPTSLAILIDTVCYRCFYALVGGEKESTDTETILKRVEAFSGWRDLARKVSKAFPSLQLNLTWGL